MYDVSLTVVSGRRQETIRREAYITVGSVRPVVDFSASATLTHERDEVTFTDLSRSEITKAQLEDVIDDE